MLTPSTAEGRSSAYTAGTLLAKREAAHEGRQGAYNARYTLQYEESG